MHPAVTRLAPIVWFRAGRHILSAFALAVLCLNAGVTAAACNRRTPPASIGTEVEAPTFDGTTAMGRVAEQYGKLARVTFDRGGETWCEATDLEPPGMPSAPPLDTCSVGVDDRVRAPWSRTGKSYAGRIAETHGRFALVRFDDGDTTWVACESIQPYERGGE